MTTTTVKKTKQNNSENNSKKITKGSILSITQYYTVLNIDFNTGIYTVIDDNGLELEIQGYEFISNMSSADIFNETKTVSRTEIINIFRNNSKTAMTVNFNTKIDDKELVEKLISIYPNKGKVESKASFEATLKSTLKTVLNGNVRTMVGRHYNKQDDFGRFSFIDMKIPKDNRIRKVDPRTINWLIVNGVKYIV